jgi:hypothetical protein
MKKKDILIIVGILLSAFVSFLIIELTKDEGAYVVVRVDGVEVGKYSLELDGEYELNGGTNILHIKDGKAYLVDAKCPDKLCVNQGKISKGGETITCLPNKLTITVYGVDSDVELVG